MKFALIIFLFYQSGITVELANTRNAGRYDEAACWEMAQAETKTLPLQLGNDARWQYATCVQIESQRRLYVERLSKSSVFRAARNVRG